MTIGSRQLKNGKTTGYLIFDSGKKVFLNSKEWLDFKLKIEMLQAAAVDRREADWLDVYPDGLQN